jgi:hypothetical protein
MPRKLPVSWTVPLAGLEEALTDALAEHDLDRPLSSVERVVAATVLTEFGRPRPEPTDSPHTIREWVTWANLNHG